MQLFNINIMISILFILIAIITLLPKLPFNEFGQNWIPCSINVRIFSGCEPVIESEPTVERPGSHILVPTSDGKKKCKDLIHLDQF